MNPEIKTRWIAALRSGDYTQTRNALKNDEGYCCAGVLCELHRKEKNKRWIKNTIGDLTYLHSAGSLPQPVELWAELSNITVMYEGDCVTVYVLNDHLGLSFVEIADIIETQL